MDDLDQTARHTIKFAPADHTGWLFPDLDADLAFSRWLDTEAIAFPGEPKRRCDTVAELRSRAGQQPPWAVVLEVEARPRSVILDRLLEYLCRVFRRVRHGPRRRDRYQVAAVLLVLTGRQRALNLDMTLPGTDVRLSWSCRVRNLSRLSAAGMLQQISRGELGRGILPWVPLMKGGGEPAVVTQWGQLLQGETDIDRRKELAGLASVFADRVGHGAAWKPLLEGIDMWESETLKEARRRGRVQEMRVVLARTIKMRFQIEPPQDLVQLFDQTDDMDTLSRWFDSALTAPSLDALRASLPLTAN